MKKTIIFTLIAATFVLIISGIALSKTYLKTWRCGSNIISIGNSKSSVFLKCGTPTSSNTTRRTTKGLLKALKNGNMTEEEFNERMQISEEWVYNCGSEKFITTLSFNNGVLTSIETGEYGSGESYCDGAESNPNNKK